MPALSKATRCSLCHEKMSAGQDFRWREASVAVTHRQNVKRWKPAHPHGAACIVEKLNETNPQPGR